MSGHICPSNTLRFLKIFLLGNLWVVFSFFTQDMDYSNEGYVEACDDMKTTNWLLCHVHVYQYFGEVTRLLIPDNLKTDVSKNTRYETILNKSLAEGTVKFATTWNHVLLIGRKVSKI